MSFAVRSPPSVNFTPGRSLNSQVRVVDVFHDVASIGWIRWFSSWSSRRSKICLVAE